MRFTSIKGCHMRKKYIVRLSIEERSVLEEIIKKLKGSSERVRRAQILLKADADGPGWMDKQIAEAFNCRTRTVEKVREALVTEGFEVDSSNNNTIFNNTVYDTSFAYYITNSRRTTLNSNIANNNSIYG